MTPEERDVHFDYESCARCGGKCCQHHSGAYWPEDFKEEITPKFILSLLNSGKFTIDWWEGDVTGGELDSTYYIRPRHVGEPAIYGSWGGQCINWSPESGCKLRPEDLPRQCKMLVPGYENGKAGCHYLPEDESSKRDCALAWHPYQAIISVAIEKYKA